MEELRNSRIFFLSDGRHAHTIKWVNALVEKGYSIFLFSLSKFNRDNFIKSDRLEFYSSGLDEHLVSIASAVWKKFVFIKEVPVIKKKIIEYKPDILHSHYASSNGLLGALSFFKPNILSVWGTDIFSFPKANPINKLLIKYTLAHSDVILSTSRIMRDEILKYTNKQVGLTPFGIDLDLFSPSNKKTELKDHVTIGTIKNLETHSGIDILIRAFHLFRKKNPSAPANLLIIGKGSKRLEIESLILELDLSKEVELIGFVEYKDIARYHNQFDIFVCVSRQESFGVAVLEASACGRPVIVSNAGGLPEVAENNDTGFIVNKESVEETAAAIEKLVFDKDLRERFGRNGREFVLRNYELNSCLDKMISIYNNVLSGK